MTVNEIIIIKKKNETEEKLCELMRLPLRMMYGYGGDGFFIILTISLCE